MSDTLKACGFGFQDPADLQSAHGKHNAATDTVRAVGAHKQRTGQRYGWVCLPSLCDLKRFLHAVYGTEHPEGGTWTAESVYDPDIIPAKDICKLKERLHATADEKREKRRMKRLASETEIYLEAIEEKQRRALFVSAHFYILVPDSMCIWEMLASVVIVVLFRVLLTAVFGVIQGNKIERQELL